MLLKHFIIESYGFDYNIVSNKTQYTYIENFFRVIKYKCNKYIDNSSAIFHQLTLHLLIVNEIIN